MLYQLKKEDFTTSSLIECSCKLCSRGKITSYGLNWNETIWLTSSKVNWENLFRVCKLFGVVKKVPIFS